MFIYQLLQSIDSILSSHPFLGTIFSVSSIIKISIFAYLIVKKTSSSKAGGPILLLLWVLIGSIIHDFSWILYVVKHSLITTINPKFTVFCYRIAWAFAFIQDLALAFFIESLVESKFILNRRRIIFMCISGILIFYFVFQAFIYVNNIGSYTPKIYSFIQHFGTIYSLLPLMLTSIFVTIRTIRTQKLPRILTKQLKLFITFLIIPYWLLELLQVFPFDFSYTWVTNSFTVLSLANILLTTAIYFCSRKIIGLRFLNFTNHVKAPIKYNFMKRLKITLEEFGHVTTINQLRQTTQNFFKESFYIPLNHTHLYIRTGDKETYLANNLVITMIETCMATNEKTSQLMRESKIFIYDEVAFSNFYLESSDYKSILHFLETMNADIFLPIYEKNNLIAYIIIDRFTRIQEFYSNVERDEMLVFASYLGNVINLFQNRNFEILLAKEKNLEEELYHKDQEINQYKESIRSFIRNSKEHDIGIIFYTQNRFTFGNQAAKELININPNVQVGHPITKVLNYIAQHVEQYKKPQSTLAKDAKGNAIVLSAVPHLDQNNVIITVYYPRVVDILKQQLDILHDPTEWDYILYLETTKSGKLINQLIPGSGEQLLRFKINLLKIALSKKAILLDIAQQDLISTVELLHHISLREKLYILDLESGGSTIELAIKLFGINPIFGYPMHERPLLETLDQVGTLFIKNINLLDLELQENLAEFIAYGFYRIYKGEQKEPSDVRIICSASQDLAILVQEGKFSEQLFNELNQTTLSMPSLTTLPKQELKTLAEGFSVQAIQTQAFGHLLTSKDKNKLTLERPGSLQELKFIVQQLLAQKSKQNQLLKEAKFAPAYPIQDPDLMQAVRLGKQALKDPKIMAMLWEKYKNQNKIAELLGVNRSSVNRRCKEYGLG